MGSLLLSNPVTSDSYEFKLIGITEEPIAADHIVIHC